MAGGGGVDHDEVPVGASLERLAQLPADLADGEDLLHARRGGGDEVERARHGSDAPEHGHPRLHLEVLTQRRLGVHLHREHARVHLAGFEPHRRVLEEVGEVVLGVDLDEQDLLALVGGEECGGRGDGALADAALAGEEEQPAVEQAGHCKG